MKNLILLIVISFSIIFSKPTSSEYLKTCFGLSSLLYSQFIYSPTPNQSSANNMENINFFDIRVRKVTKWSNAKLEHASSLSDWLLYGVTLSSIPIIPLLSNEDYYDNLFLQLDILSLNGVITNFVKVVSSRERPKYRFNSKKNKSNETYKSFFSGHTSTAFSIGVSNAIILSEQYPEHSSKIWLTSIGIATATGYYRIASDEHYASDVIAGSIAGSLVGYFLHKKNNSKKFKYSSSLNTLHFTVPIGK